MPDKRVRLTAYVTPKTMKALNGMSENLEKPIGQIIDELMKGIGG